jgi:dTDP-glucose 4,6-dehydratase
MKILVTGGAGFIGSNYLLIMTKKHPEDYYVCLDALTYAGNLETLKSIINDSHFKFVKGNICDEKLVDQLFKSESFDIVINFAAETHVDRSIENPQIFLTSNVLGTGVLLNASKKYHVKRFHQVSTDEVYGDLPLNRKDLFFTENTPLHTSSPYSSSKAGADLLVLSYFRTYGLPVTISRCSNNYGPYQFPEKLIPLMIQKALKGEKLPIYGTGDNVRDWLHVSDHCQGIDLIIRKGLPGEVYNIGGHNEKSNIDVVKIILHSLGKDDNLISFVKDRLGHDKRYAIDPSKIEKLGWKPQYDFEKGIKDTIQWNIQNQEWINHVETGEYKTFMKLYYKDR